MEGKVMSEWISVKDRLPDEAKWVLTGSCNIGAVDHGCRIGNDFFMHGEMNKKMNWVTHWMPLPQPPRKSSD